MSRGQPPPSRRASSHPTAQPRLPVSPSRLRSSRQRSGPFHGGVIVFQALNPKDARVLVVEDSPTDREIVAHALRTFGIRHLEMARTAEEALKQPAYQPFDVPPGDYNLPGMN